MLWFQLCTFNTYQLVEGLMTTKHPHFCTWVWNICNHLWQGLTRTSLMEGERGAVLGQIYLMSWMFPWFGVREHTLVPLHIPCFRFLLFCFCRNGMPYCYKSLIKFEKVTSQLTMKIWDNFLYTWGRKVRVAGWRSVISTQ